MGDLIKRRFDKLEHQAETLISTKNARYLPQSGYDQVDQSLLINWIVKVKNVLVKACGIDSQHFMNFTQAESPKSFQGSYPRFEAMLAVFRAAKKDFEGGYLVSMRGLIQAEVFDSELEQASELLRRGYDVAAAVIAGTVLETALREFCIRNQIPPGKLDKMNANLTKVITQKRITHLAAVRNSAMTMSSKHMM